jgi:hypothetical protein
MSCCAVPCCAMLCCAVQVSHHIHTNDQTLDEDVCRWGEYSPWEKGGQSRSLCVVCVSCLLQGCDVLCCCEYSDLSPSRLFLCFSLQQPAPAVLRKVPHAVRTSTADVVLIYSLVLQHVPSTQLRVGHPPPP